MVKKSPTNPAVTAVLVIGMVFGFAVIAVGEVDDLSALIPSQLSGFEILSVDQDPVTGEIRGNLILGKPEIQGTAWTGAKKSSNCPLGTQGGFSSGSSISFGSGSSSGGCTVGYAEWDLSELPDDFTTTSMIFKVQSENIPAGMTGRSCKIGIIEQPLSTIGSGNLVSKAQTPDTILVEGDWCQTTGEKSFILDQNARDAFSRALTGDDKITLAFTLTSWTKGTLCCWNQDRNHWGTEGSFVINGFAEPIQCAEGTHQVGFKCEPLQCDEGFEVNGNICSRIQCPVGEELIGSVCTPIECNVGERLVGNTCEQIICPVGTTLVGNDCDPIICSEGFTLSGNECTPIVCPVGNELVGSQCQSIACPTGTFLQGNDCVDIVCPAGTYLEGNNCAEIICNQGEFLSGDICTPIQCSVGQRLVGNDCQNIVCETGTELIGNDCVQIQCLASEELVGNDCVPKPLDCPVGTVESQNVCIQVLPQLQATGAPLNFLTVTGIGIFMISFGGFVVRSIVRRSL